MILRIEYTKFYIGVRQLSDDEKNTRQYIGIRQLHDANTCIGIKQLKVDDLDLNRMCIETLKIS